MSNPLAFFVLPLAAPIKLWDGNPAIFNGQPLLVRDVLNTALSKVDLDADQQDGVDTRIHKMVLTMKIAQGGSHLEMDLNDVLFLAPLVVRSFVHPAIYTNFVQVLAHSVVLVPQSQPPAPAPVEPPEPLPDLPPAELA
jgi:hypothetical protein